MSDIRKLLQKLDETVAGAVASVAMPLGGAVRRSVKEETKEQTTEESDDSKKYKNSTSTAGDNTGYANKTDTSKVDVAADPEGTPDMPEVIEYGFWGNSAESTQQATKKKRKSDDPKGAGKSVYSAHPELTQTVDHRKISKKNTVQESKKDFLSKLQKNIDKSNKKKKETDEKVKQHQDVKKKVDEEKLEEHDIIINPAAIKKYSGIISKKDDRTDHEVAMARSDLIAAMKNAQRIFELIKDRGEEDGIEGWVQEKLIKANDYLNAVREYMDEQAISAGMASSFESDVFETADVTDYSPKSSGGTRKELLAKYHKTKDPKDAAAARRAGATQQELQGKMSESVYSDESDESPVMSAIIRRIMRTRPDLLQHGPERVLDAVRDVADFVGDTEEIGTSDVSGWVKQVEDILRDAAQGVSEGKTGPGLWANIHAKRERIKRGSGERMRKPGSEGAPSDEAIKSARKGSTNESVCSECGGPSYSDPIIAEEKDACYHKVKSRYKVWPSAYASGALVKCRKAGAKNWGNKSKK